MSYNKLTEVALGLLKEKYRDDIALQLVKEEEEENKSKDASFRSKCKNAKKKDLKKTNNAKAHKATSPESNDNDSKVYEMEQELEEYDDDYWQHFEFYKHFFEAESINESLVVVSGANYEKSRKKKAKKSKKSATSSAAANIVATRHTSESNDYSSTTTSNDIAKIFESVPEDLPAQPEKEEFDKLELENISIECPTPPPKPNLESKVTEEATTTPPEAVLETAVHEAVPATVTVPEFIPEVHEPEMLSKPKADIDKVLDQKSIVSNEEAIDPSTTKSKKKKKKHKKAHKAANKKAKAEYEEFKEKTMQLFANLTGSTAPPKKPVKIKKVPKPKKSQKKSLPKGTDCTNSQCGTAASHASDFASSHNTYEGDEAFLQYEYDEFNLAGEKGWNDEYNEGEDFDNWAGGYDDGLDETPSKTTEKDSPIMVLSPYVGNLLESKFFDKLNVEIADLVESVAEHNRNVWKIAEKVQETLTSLARSALNGTLFSQAQSSLENSITTSVYGSAAAGLALVTSDIDIAISGISSSSKDDMLENMLVLGKALSENSPAKEVQVIQSASVPVIKTVRYLAN